MAGKEHTAPSLPPPTEGEISTKLVRLEAEEDFEEGLVSDQGWKAKKLDKKMMETMKKKGQKCLDTNMIYVFQGLVDTAMGTETKQLFCDYSYM